MTTPQTNLRVRISAELSDIKSGLMALRRDLQGVKREAAGALSGRQAEFAEGLRSARQQLAGLVAGFVSLRTVGRFAQLADEAAQLSGRLRLATRSQQDFARAQRDTFAISQRNQVALATTVDLYGRLARATQRLGLGAGQQSALTETILQAGRLSFASNEGLNAAIVQLGQGLSSGQLRGEELNSVLEQTPRLAQAIQDGLRELGVKGAEDLRKLAKEGALTPELIVQAIMTQQARLAEEAAQLPRTIAGTMTELSNAVLKFINDSSEANSAAQSIIQFLKAIADNLPQIVSTMVTATRIAVAYFLVFRAAPAVIGGATALLTAFKNQVIATRLAQELGIKTSVGWAGGIKRAAGIAFSAFVGWEIGSYLRDQFVEVELAGYALVQGLMTGFNNLRRATVIAFEAVRFAITSVLAKVRNEAADAFDRLAGLASSTNAFGLNTRFVEKLQGWSSALRTTGGDLSQFGKRIAELNAEFDRQNAQIELNFMDLAEAAMAAREATEGALGAGDGDGTGAGGGGGGAVRARANDLELLRDAAQRSLKTLEDLYADGKISMEKYFAKKADLERAAIDLSIQAAQAELRAADSVEAQGRALTEIIKLQRDRAEVGPRLAREQAAAERELANELQNLSIRMLELRGNEEAAAAVRLGQQLDPLRERFQREGNELGVQLVDQVFNEELWAQRADRLGSRISEALAALRSETEYLATQAELGGLSPIDAERQLQEVRNQTLAQLRQLRQEAAAAYNERPTPETLATLRQLDTEILQLTESQKVFKNAARDGAVNALKGFFTDLATGARSFKDAFKNMVLSFIQGLAQMAAEALAKRIILSVFGAFGGGGGGGAGIASIGAGVVGAGVFHGGTGSVGSGGARRHFSAPAFAAIWGQAPRFHEGVNLRANEIPAILERGERVLSKAENARYSEGGRPAPGFRIYNIQDPSFVPDAMGGPEGEEVIMNQIGRNVGRVRAMLGVG